MKFSTVLLWLILFVLCAPLALFALKAFIILWLLMLPFRLLGLAGEGVAALLEAVWKLVMLPFRILRTVMS